MYLLYFFEGKQPFKQYLGLLWAEHKRKQGYKYHKIEPLFTLDSDIKDMYDWYLIKVEGEFCIGLFEYGVELGYKRESYITSIRIDKLLYIRKF